MSVPIPASLAEAIPAGVVVLDRAGKIVQASSRAAEAIVGADFFSTYGSGKAYDAARDSFLARVATEELALEFEAGGRRIRIRGFEHEGERFALALVEPLEGDARTLAIVAAWERALPLVSEVRHEINNPLMGILGQAELLGMRSDLPEAVRKKVEMIEKEAERIRETVKLLHSIRPF